MAQRSARRDPRRQRAAWAGAVVRADRRSAGARAERSERVGRRVAGSVRTPASAAGGRRVGRRGQLPIRRARSRGATSRSISRCRRRRARTLAACVAGGCPLVIGTTGLDAAVRAQIGRPRARFPIVMAPNMSLGVNLLLELVELAARSAGRELRHRDLRGAPSQQEGCAVRDGAGARRGRSRRTRRRLDDVGDYARHGVTGARGAARSAFPSSAAATSSASTPSSSPARGAHRADAPGHRSPRFRARRGPGRALARGGRRASTRCRTCWDSDRAERARERAASVGEKSCRRVPWTFVPRSRRLPSLSKR